MKISPHRLLATLHAHGLHAAVLAGLVMGPAVVAVGFLTEPVAKAVAPLALGGLRGILDDAAAPITQPHGS